MADYSPDQFYLSSRDKKGFSTTLRINLPPELMNELAMLAESKKLPYRTKADVVRDALYHRVEMLKEMDPSPEWKARIKGLFAREEAMRVIEDRARFVETQEELGEGLNKARAGERKMIAEKAMEYASGLGAGYEAEMKAFLGGRGL